MSGLDISSLRQPIGTAIHVLTSIRGKEGAGRDARPACFARISFWRRVAQFAERPDYTGEVAGSNPAPPTKVSRTGKQT